MKVAPRNALGVSIEIGSPPHHMRHASAIINERPSVTSTCASSLPGRRRSSRRSTKPPNTATPNAARIAAGQKLRPSAISDTPK